MERVEVEEAEERAFWLAASESALRRIWDNPDDDVYAQLLNGPEDTVGESRA